MAEEKEANLEEQEKKIPVFTVLKNNTILKNIFVIDNPPSNSESFENGHQSVQENEEILVVGRHPDCNITLEHPSISRFHLRIHSNPASQNLSVVDLSSVHGTWISGTKIEPGVTVELKEGDTMRMGGSSRVYKLHWIPLGRAYDLENPFISPLDALPEEKEEEEEEDDDQQDENRFLVEKNQIGPLGYDFEAMDSLFSDKNSDLCLKKLVPSAPPLPEYMKFSFSDEGGNKNPLWNNSENIENQQFEKENQNPQTLSVSEVLCESINPDCFSEKEPNLANNLSPSFSQEEFGRKNHEEKEISSPTHQPFMTEYVDSCLASRIVISTIKDQQFEKENQVSQPLLATGFSRREHSKSTPTRLEHKPNLSDEEEGRPVAEILEVIEKPSKLRKDHEQTESLTLRSGTFTAKSATSSNVLSEIGNQQSEEQIETPPTHFTYELSGREETESPLVKSGQKGIREIEKTLSEVENQQSEEENEPPQTHFASGMCGWEDSESPTIKAERKGVFKIENVLSEVKNHQSDKENQTPQTHFASGDFGIEDQESAPIKLEQKGIFEFENVLSKIKNQESDYENQIPQTHFASGVFGREDPESPPIKSENKSSLAASIWSRRGKATCSPQIQTGKSRGKGMGVDINVEYETLYLEDIGNYSISKTLFANLDGDEEEIFTLDKENFTPNTILMRSMKKMSNTEETLRRENVGSNSISQKLTFVGGDDEETFTPDKENFAPNTLLVRSAKKLDKAKEIRCSKSERPSSLKYIIGPNTQSEGSMIPFSDTQNQTQKVLREQKPARPTSSNRAILEPEVMVLKSRTQRGPFQHLQVSSTEKNKSEVSILSATMRNSNSLNYGQTIQKITNPSVNNSTRGGERRKWNMVVDSTCLLNKKSRKALQLLQGVQGTQLIIPRIVIRELDCMKRRGSLFRRQTDGCLALEWIEECMENTKWWIHVQSSVDETKLIAPTPPPASLQSRFSEGSVPFSGCGCLLEVVSPTAEDHVLECALLLRRIKNDGHLILLSSDVTLKIKAMAEGMICETSEDFRESLVNPFSERFLWADSSPRGPTWSLEDDVVLREKYDCCALKKPSKLGEGAKGLKLILLHNSHYGRRTSSVPLSNLAV